MSDSAHLEAGSRWPHSPTQQLLRELRNRAKVKEQQRRQAEARRAQQLGEAVLAIFGDWEAAELLGALLDARERINDSSNEHMLAVCATSEFPSAPALEVGLPVIDQDEAEQQLLAALRS